MPLVDKKTVLLPLIVTVLPSAFAALPPYISALIVPPEIVTVLLFAETAALPPTMLEFPLSVPIVPPLIVVVLPFALPPRE